MPLDWEFWRQVATQTFTLFVMLVGLAGLIIPIFPGLVIIWIAALIFGFLTGFTTLGWVIFAVLTVFMVVGNVADNIMMSTKARQGGASWLSISLGMLAGILGSLVIPPIGGIIGAPLVLFLAEYMRQRQVDKAFASTRALLIGWGWSFVIRFIIGLVMIGLWMIWAWA